MKTSANDVPTNCGMERKCFAIEAKGIDKRWRDLRAVSRGSLNHLHRQRGLLGIKVSLRLSTWPNICLSWKRLTEKTDRSILQQQQTSKNNLVPLFCASCLCHPSS